MVLDYDKFSRSEFVAEVMLSLLDVDLVEGATLSLHLNSKTISEVSILCNAKYPVTLVIRLITSCCSGKESTLLGGSSGAGYERVAKVGRAYNLIQNKRRKKATSPAESMINSR